MYDVSLNSNFTKSTTTPTVQQSGNRFPTFLYFDKDPLAPLLGHTLGLGGPDLNTIDMSI